MATKPASSNWPTPDQAPDRQPDETLLMFDQHDDRDVLTRSSVIDRQPLPGESPPTVPRQRWWLVRSGTAVVTGVEWLFGFACLLVILAAIATLPGVQLISLGYLLESAGRVARSGRLRSGIFHVPQAARIGSLIAGTWLMLLPLRLISDYWYSSFLIDATGSETRAWRIALIVATTAMLAHILMSWYCGGRFRHFLWPLLAVATLPWWVFCHLVSRLIKDSALRSTLSPRPLNRWFPPAIVLAAIRRGGWYGDWRDAVWEFLVSLQIPHLFLLGLRGAAGTLVWLTVPILLLISATSLPAGPGVLTGLTGGLMLALVMLYLPFMQARFAAENRWRALFQIREVRTIFRRAPVAFAAALVVTLLFALPLYLLKIELTPREVAFLPCLVFIAFIFPARLLTGWALFRATKRTKPQWFFWRWAARLVELPVVLFYVWIVFLTSYTSWYGMWSLFEQHALLIPVPFLGL